jgi:hypothetical protein
MWRQVTVKWQLGKIKWRQVTVKATDLTSEAVKVDLNQPMATILAQLSKYAGAWGGGCFLVVCCYCCSD